MRPEEALPARADAVIVGGGIVGCAIAYYLAKRGMSVVLLEPGFPARGGSLCVDQHERGRRRPPRGPKTPNAFLQVAEIQFGSYRSILRAAASPQRAMGVNRR